MIAQAAVRHHHSIMRASGAIAAVVSYDQRPDGDPRNVVVVVRRNGQFVMRRELRSLRYGIVTLTLRDIWGSHEPEVIVRGTVCGNRCGYWVYILIPKTRHLFWRWFGHNGVSIQKNDIVSTDERFFCAFDSCADSSEPEQVFSIDASGSRFVDVTRSHRSLLRSDAAFMRSNGALHLLGVRAAYCADEYLLGIRAYCNRALPARVRKQMAAWGYR